MEKKIFGSQLLREKDHFSKDGAALVYSLLSFNSWFHLGKEERLLFLSAYVQVWIVHFQIQFL